MQRIDAENLLVKDKEYYIQFKFFEHVTKFLFVYSESRKNFALKKLRVHYFFSLSKDINATLKNLLVDIRITESQHWDSVVFGGKSIYLRDFMTEYCSFKTILLPKAVSLFSSELTHHLALQVNPYSNNRQSLV
eukprot:TRINITY_DN15430_c0_g1_i3.p1 TRINITY_DN15430_c0_g1~~TRINITY_DN15430_c0_g1_i3.p1  ORF type:complete len:134 (-),score=14.14 TRINITY_DN15430_c0_g1_i3:133-534(-)